MTADLQTAAETEVQVQRAQQEWRPELTRKVKSFEMLRNKLNCVPSLVAPACLRPGPMTYEARGLYYFQKWSIFVYYVFS